jgi:hypothetical protein
MTLLVGQHSLVQQAEEASADVEDCSYFFEVMLEVED